MPECCAGHPIDGCYWVINPEGGYGRPELLCCEEHLSAPPYVGFIPRLIDAGAMECEVVDA